MVCPIFDVMSLKLVLWDTSRTSNWGHELHTSRPTQGHELYKSCWTCWIVTPMMPDSCFKQLVGRWCTSKSLAWWKTLTSIIAMAEFFMYQSDDDGSGYEELNPRKLILLTEEWKKSRGRPQSDRLFSCQSSITLSMLTSWTNAMKTPEVECLIRPWQPGR